MPEQQGRRLPDGSYPFAEGDYGKGEDGVWYARPPGAHLGSLKAHEITEHEDGTITASPSILIHEGEVETFHGWLERGVWRWS